MNIATQEFDLQIRDKKVIKDKKRTDNLVADHMSRLSNAPSSNILINEHFSDEQLFTMLREP